MFVAAYLLLRRSRMLSLFISGRGNFSYVTSHMQKIMDAIGSTATGSAATGPASPSGTACAHLLRFETTGPRSRPKSRSKKEIQMTGPDSRRLLTATASLEPPSGTVR